MAVYKYRSVEAMESQPVLVRTDDGFERLLRHCARYRRFSSRELPRGVFKFRTMEEAQAARDAGRTQDLADLEILGDA